MGDLVNLRTARKQASRRQAEQKAAANRASHGRSKSERTLTRAKSDKVLRSLDQHRVGKLLARMCTDPKSLATGVSSVTGDSILFDNLTTAPIESKEQIAASALFA